jgi:hypothetical protein
MDMHINTHLSSVLMHPVTSQPHHRINSSSMAFIKCLMFVTANIILLLLVDTHQSLVAGQSGGYPEYAAHAV